MTASEAIKLIETDLEKLYKFDDAMSVYAQRLRRNAHRQTTRLLAEITDQGRLLTAGPRMVQVMNELERALIDIVGNDQAKRYLKDVATIITRRSVEMNRLIKKLGLPPEALLGPDMSRNPRVLNALERVSDAMARSNAVATQKIAQTIAKYKTLANTSDAVPYKKFLSELQVSASIPARYTGTVANTSLMSMDRELRQDQARGADIENAKYVGPRDSITRQFCVTHLDQVRSWTYWEQTSNSVGPNPPAYYGGGWNCRHALVPWLDEWDAETETTTEPVQQDVGQVGQALTKEQAIEQTKSMFTDAGISVKATNIDSAIDLTRMNTRNSQLSKLLSEYDISPRFKDSAVTISMQSTNKFAGVVVPNPSRFEFNFGHVTDSRRATLRENVMKMYQMPKSIVDPAVLDLATLTHEFAHVMAISQNYVRVRASTQEALFFKEMKNLKMKYKRELNRLHREGREREMLDIYLGDYADKDVDEFFAEAWTEGKLNSKPSKYAKLVVELVDKYFKKK